MDTADHTYPKGQESTARRRSANRRAAVIVAVMVVLWLVAILLRNDIRAQWWTWQLARTEVDSERVGYTIKLATLRDQAVPAVLPLLEGADPGLRLSAVAVLHHAPGAEALTGLERASEDADADVRRSAMRGLARRAAARAGTTLGRRFATGDERTAMMAAHALGASRWEMARQTLIAAVNSHPHVGARVEAIQALSELRDREAVPALIEALRDRSVFEGMTEADIQMVAAFEAIAPRLMSETGLSETPTVEIETHHVVAEGAMSALLAITNRTDVAVNWRGAPVESVVRNWHAWWESHRESP